MSIEILSKETQAYVRSCAAKCGVTDADVLNHIEEIYSGNGVSIHSRMLTIGKIRKPYRADFSRIMGV